MPIWIISLAARAGVPAAFRKAVAYLALAVLLIIAIGCGIAAWNSWRVHDNTRFVEERDRNITIEAANRVIAAERAATAHQIERADVFANSQEGLRDEVRTKGTTAPVGPAVAGVLERMRRDQAAGRRGSAPGAADVPR